MATRDFPDHHVFTSREVAGLIAEARRRRAILATTEKDRTRLGPEAARAVVTLPVALRFDAPNRVRDTLRMALG